MKRAAIGVFRRLPRRTRIALISAATPSYTCGAVLALSRDDGRMLFVEQRHTGAWALPGGLLQRGEHPAAAVVREVAEEVGITLDPASLPLPIASLAPDVRRVDIVYRMTGGETVTPHRPEEDIEVTGLGWFPLDGLPPVTAPTLDILRSVRLLPPA